MGTTNGQIRNILDKTRYSISKKYVRNILLDFANLNWDKEISQKIINGLNSIDKNSENKLIEWSVYHYRNQIYLSLIYNSLKFNFEYNQNLDLNFNADYCFFETIHRYNNRKKTIYQTILIYNDGVWDLKRDTTINVQVGIFEYMQNINFYDYFLENRKVEQNWYDTLELAQEKNKINHYSFYEKLKSKIKPEIFKKYKSTPLHDIFLNHINISDNVLDDICEGLNNLDLEAINKSLRYFTIKVYNNKNIMLYFESYNYIFQNNETNKNILKQFKSTYQSYSDVTDNWYDLDYKRPYKEENRPWSQFSFEALHYMNNKLENKLKFLSHFHYNIELRRNMFNDLFFDTMKDEQYESALNEIGTTEHKQKWMNLLEEAISK